MAFRLRYPAVVDGAYSASAPVRLYAQEVDPAAYYAVITRAADEAVPGCAAGVRSAFAALYRRAEGATVHALAQLLGICDGGVKLNRLFLEGNDPPLPEYMRYDVTTFLEEVSMVVMFTFATLNMGYYPPNRDNPLVQACSSFAEASGDEGRLLGALQRLLASAAGSRVAGNAIPGTRRFDWVAVGEGPATAPQPCAD